MDFHLLGKYSHKLFWLSLILGKLGRGWSWSTEVSLLCQCYHFLNHVYSWNFMQKVCVHIHHLTKLKVQTVISHKSVKQTEMHRCIIPSVSVCAEFSCSVFELSSVIIITLSNTSKWILNKRICRESRVVLGTINENTRQNVGHSK